jgi:hypothetical protein
LLYTAVHSTIIYWSLCWLSHIVHTPFENRNSYEEEEKSCG